MSVRPVCVCLRALSWLLFWQEADVQRVHSHTLNDHSGYVFLLSGFVHPVPVICGPACSTFSNPEDYNQTKAYKTCNNTLKSSIQNKKLHICVQNHLLLVITCTDTGCKCR